MMLSVSTAGIACLIWTVVFRITEAKLAKVTFLTPHSAFLDLHSMPETVEISLTVGLATLSPLTLLRRDDGFQNARVLVPGMDQDTTFRGVHLNVDKDFALFTGMSSHSVNVAVGLHRTWLTNNSIDLQLADDSLLVVNDSAFSLKPLPRSRQTRSADDALEKRYRLFPRFPEAGAHVTFNSGGDHQRSRRETRSERKDKTTLYLDICVVVDYYLFKKVKDKHGTWGGVQLDLKETRRYVAMVMNEVNLLYKIWSDNSPFNVNIGIASIAVEVNPDMDFFGLQARPEVRLKSDGLVLQDILATHDIVTAWFKTYHSYLSCDHLMLLSGTTAAETVADAYGDPILVLSDILGIAWNFAFCSVADGLSSSVVITDRVRTFILAAHELGHSLGAVHDQETEECRNQRGFIMDALAEHPITVRHYRGLWSECSLHDMQQSIRYITRQDPQCMKEKSGDGRRDIDFDENQYTGHFFTPDQQCRLAYGARFVFDRASTKGNYSTICQSITCRSTRGFVVQRMIPAPGTSCGVKKQCDVQSKCMSTTTLQRTQPDDCPFGDHPGPLHTVMRGMAGRCSEIRRSPCATNRKVSWYCCQTCAALYDN